MPFSYLKRSAAARLRGRWMTNESWYSVKPWVGSSGHSGVMRGGRGRGRVLQRDQRLLADAAVVARRRGDWAGWRWCRPACRPWLGVGHAAAEPPLPPVPPDRRSRRCCRRCRPDAAGAAAGATGAAAGAAGAAAGAARAAGAAGAAAGAAGAAAGTAGAAAAAAGAATAASLAAATAGVRVVARAACAAPAEKVNAAVTSRARTERGNATLRRRSRPGASHDGQTPRACPRPVSAGCQIRCLPVGGHCSGRRAFTPRASKARASRSLAFNLAALSRPMRIRIFCPADRASCLGSSNWNRRLARWAPGRRLGVDQLHPDRARTRRASPAGGRSPPPPDR